MHPYYTVALAPGIAALVGVGSTALWAPPGVARRPRRVGAHGRGDRGVELRAAGRLGRVVRVAPLGRRRPRCAGGGGLLVGAGRLRRAALVGVVAALLTGLVGSGAYAVATASVAHTGSIPTVGHDEQRDGRRPAGWRAVGDRPAGAPAADERLRLGRRAPPQGGGTARQRGRRRLRPGRARGGQHEQRADRAAHGHGRHVVRSGRDLADRGLAGARDRHGRDVDGWLGRLGQCGHPRAVPGRRRLRADLLLHRRGPRRGPGGDSDSTSSQIAEWVAANYTATTVGGQTVYDLQS